MHDGSPCRQLITHWLFWSASASVSGASNKLGEWLIDCEIGLLCSVHDLSIFLHGLAQQWRQRQKQNLAQRQPRGWGWCLNVKYTHSAEKVSDTTLDDDRNYRNIIQCCNNTSPGDATYFQTNVHLHFGPRWR